jgi:anti-sigma regulatory factor (Ser/Thr protein kinase)
MMIFGGLNAYDIINPKLLSEFTYVNSFQISGIEKLDNQGKKTFLNYNENEIIKSTTGEVIKVHLTNFDFHFGKGYIFQYSIDSKNWFKTDNNQTFLLSNLAYGDYVLKIRMFNPFGQLVTEKTFQLQIDTSFYYRTEFYVLIIILILLLSILFILFLIRSIRVKTKTRSKIAMDLHDESGTILTRLLLLSKKEKFDDQDIERLRNGLKEALYNFRTYLDVLSRKKHSWQDLTDEIQEFIHQICTDSNVSYKFINDFDDDQIIKRELFRDIKLTTYEVITNSLKYSRSKTLTIQFLLKENNFKMIISDFGTFHITDLDERKGNGLRNIKKRVTRNKGCYSYYNTSELGGITVEINMPIK